MGQLFTYVNPSDQTSQPTSLNSTIHVPSVFVNLKDTSQSLPPQSSTPSPFLSLYLPVSNPQDTSLNLFHSLGTLILRSLNPKFYHLFYVGESWATRVPGKVTSSQHFFPYFSIFVTPVLPLGSRLVPQTDFNPSTFLLCLTVHLLIQFVSCVVESFVVPSPSPLPRLCRPRDLLIPSRPGDPVFSS